MAQHDMNIANQGFPAFRADLNDALAALVSNSSGATAPATTFAHQFWVDTNANPSVLKQRNADNDAWVTIGSINQTSDTFNLAVAQGGTGAADAAGARTNLGALAAANPEYTGTLTGGTGVVNLGSGQFYKDASGNVGIGTSSPTRRLELGTLGAFRMQTGSVTMDCTPTSGATDGFVWNVSNGYYGWSIGGTSRMLLDSSGNLLVGTTTVRGGITSGINAWRFAGDASDTGPGAFRHVAAGSTRIEIYGNGNVANSNGVYGSFSDVKLKENITDATPKLEKLAQVRVVNYNLKTDPDQKLLGVIAQELEQIFPGIVDEHVDRDEDGNDLGTTTKSVKYSVFVPMLIKAIQEQQAIINAQQAALESLTARIEALEGN